MLTKWPTGMKKDIRSIKEIKLKSQREYHTATRTVQIKFNKINKGLVKM